MSVSKASDRAIKTPLPRGQRGGLRGSGGFRAVAEWRVGLPHGVKVDGELAGDGNLRPLEPRCLRKPQPSSLQPGEPNTSRQDDVGSLAQLGIFAQELSPSGE